MLDYIKFELIQYKLYRKLKKGQYYGYNPKGSSVPPFWSDKELEGLKYEKYEVHTPHRSYYYDFNKNYDK